MYIWLQLTVICLVKYWDGVFHGDVPGDEEGAKWTFLHQIYSLSASTYENHSNLFHLFITILLKILFNQNIVLFENSCSITCILLGEKIFEHEHMFKPSTNYLFLGSNKVTYVVYYGNENPGIRVLSWSVLSEFTDGHGIPGTQPKN